MGINVSVQYNDGLLPDVILLIQGYYHRGARLNTMKSCFFLQPTRYKTATILNT